MNEMNIPTQLSRAELVQRTALSQGEVFIPINHTLSSEIVEGVTEKP